MTKEALAAKFAEARKAANGIKLTRKRMVNLHNEMKLLSDLEPTQRVKKAALQDELSNEQASYRKTLMDLQLLKVETGHQKHAVEQAKLRLLRKFQDWWAAQISCCSAFSVPTSGTNEIPSTHTKEQDPDAGFDVEVNDLSVETPAPSTPPRPHSCQEPRPSPANAAQRQLQVQVQHLRPWSAGAPTGLASSASADPHLTEVATADNGTTIPVTTIWRRPLSLPLPPRSEATCRPVPVVPETKPINGSGQEQKDSDDAETVVKEDEATTEAAGASPLPAPPANDDEEYIRNNIALTGEPEVDREIIEFYKARNRICQP